jgi:hypothetical protein
MPRHPIFIEDGQKAPGQIRTPPATSENSPPEEELGVGDAASSEKPPSEDDTPSSGRLINRPPR